MRIVDGLNASKFDRTYLEELRSANVVAVNISMDMWAQARETLSNISAWYKFIADNHDIATLVRSGADIEAASQAGKVGIILGIQNTSPLEDDISLVEVFNELGLKIMLLTYNNQNLVGSGCYEATDGGISRFGKNVVREMNRVGMLIDLAHCGDRTCLEAIEHSSRPVSITHANPSWLYPKVRNKSQDVFKLLNEREGMLGVTLFPSMMSGEDTTPEEFSAMVAESAEYIDVSRLGIGTDCTTNRDDAFMHWVRMGRWTREMDYGSGTKDSPTRPPWPAWFQRPADFPNVADALENRGFSETEVAGIMGENWVRFLAESFKPQYAEDR